MDEFLQLAVETIDPAKNITTAEIDYRVMQATLITNSNENRVRVVHDALGEVVAFAQMGKTTESAGDSIDDVTPVIPDAEILSFINAPSRATGLKLLAKSGGRTLVCRKRLTSPSSEKALPTFRLALVRTEHHQSDSGDIQVDITYLNGRGAEFQTVKLNHWDGAETKWCVAAHSVQDAQGNVVMEFQPYFSSSAFLRPLTKQQQPFQLRFLDALRRCIGTLSPDHTWAKTRLHPWMTTEYESSDNLQVADPRSDLDVGYYFSSLNPELFVPSWLELRSISSEARIRDSAAEAAKHACNPRRTHFDTRGNAIEILELGEGRTRTTRSDFDVFGNLTAKFDVLGREVERSEFDVLGRPFIQRSMESGARVALLANTGQVVMECNSARIQRRMVYDSLRRKSQTWVLEPESKSEILWSKIKYGEQEPEAASKNLRGHVFEVADQSGIRRNTLYDFKGNCQSTSLYLALEYRTTIDWRQQVAVKEEPHTSSFMFDAINRAKTDTDAAGNISIRTFDAIGHLETLHSSKVKDGSSTATHITKAVYAADGQPLRIDYGNSSHSVYTYDEKTRLLTHQRTWRDDGTVLEDLSWIYDCLGRVSTVEDAAHQTQFFRNEMIAPRRKYWYDDFGRLIRASGRERIEAGANTSRSLRQVLSSSPLLCESLPFGQASEVCGYVEMYSYDDANNILSVQHQSSDASIAGWTRTYEYKEPSRLEPFTTNNRLSRTEIGGLTEEYGYDGDAGQVGCMTSMPGFSRLGWDCNNKVRCTARQKVNDGEPETTWYVYDDSGRRVRKVVDRETTGSLEDSQPRQLKETLFLDALEIHHTYEGDGRTKKTITNTSLISGIPSSRAQTSVSIEELVLTTEKSRLSPTTLTRYHMSASLETDDKGRIVSYEEYNPFGVSMLLACRSHVEAPRRYRFAAYRRDNETGLYACGARYYAPWLGRWTSPDPLGTADGDNVYAYVQNDPVNWVDPGGTMRFCFWRSAKVQPTNTNRRGATQDYANDLKKNSLAGFVQHQQHQEEALLNEKPWHKRKIEQAGGGTIVAVTAAKAVTTKAVSFVPAVGPLLSFFISAALGGLEAQLKEAGLKKKDIERRVASYKLGMQDMLENMQGEVALILAKDGLSPDEQHNAILALLGMQRNRANAEANEIDQREGESIEDEVLDQAFYLADEYEGDEGQNNDSIHIEGSEENFNASSGPMEGIIERKPSISEVN
jgi:RHS repeat-associated protein